MCDVTVICSAANLWDLHWLVHWIDQSYGGNNELHTLILQQLSEGTSPEEFGVQLAEGHRRGTAQESADPGFWRFVYWTGRRVWLLWITGRLLLSVTVMQLGHCRLTVWVKYTFCYAFVDCRLSKLWKRRKLRLCWSTLTLPLCRLPRAWLTRLTLFPSRQSMSHRSVTERDIFTKPGQCTGCVKGEIV